MAPLYYVGYTLFIQIKSKQIEPELLLLYTSLFSLRLSSQRLHIPSLWAHWWLTGSQIALPEQPDLILPKGANNTMQHTLIVEQHQISLFPIVRIHQLRTDTRSLQIMHNPPDFLKIIDDAAIRQMDLSHCTGIHLQRPLSRQRVSPAHGQNGDFALVDLWQLGVRQLGPFREEAKAIRAGLCAGHPDVRVWGVFDLGRQGELLLRGGQKVEHLVARDEGCGAQRNLQGLRGVVVVAEGLRAAAWDAHGEERGHHGRVEVVKCSVDVPAVEAGEVEIVFS